MQKELVEEFVEGAVGWLRLGIESLGALVIFVGVFVALRLLLKSLIARDVDFNAIRLVLARYLTLALEFQLGADILSTAIAPSWQQIGKLGAIAVIRTALNYFLSREMREEKLAAEGERHTVGRAEQRPSLTDDG